MKKLWVSLLAFMAAMPALASETDLVMPDLSSAYFQSFGLDGHTLLLCGFLVIALGLIFSARQYTKVKKMSVAPAMADVSQIIYNSCKAYLKQQAKFLSFLLLLISLVVIYYFGWLEHLAAYRILIILSCTFVGIAGSYTVAWFGMRINTLANSRTAYASVNGKGWPIVATPLRSGMSIGVFLICLELLIMLCILLFMPRDLAGACFIGFAIGESLGASALRIAGGIFTKVADIGADLMKIIFKLDEDDPKNPGVIADCVGDNAGDSVGPTADGFETYGVTGVALISFIVLMFTSNPVLAATLITWIFAMRILMVVTSLAAYWINDLICETKYYDRVKFNFENPLTSLIWLTASISIVATYAISYFMLRSAELPVNLWWQLSTVISCGTLASALIPELTKAFTSPHSRHTQEIVSASREGGASLNVLSGIVAGNFSAYWIGLAVAFLMYLSYWSISGITIFGEYGAIFAFGLVAFGLLGMGPITIAVDSYGPVTDNAQSVFELSKYEDVAMKTVYDEKTRASMKNKLIVAKDLLECNDSAGNTFKATAKPVLIGTAVIGAATMIFSIILILTKAGLLKLSLIDPLVIIGLLIGGTIVDWFSGAAIQAVTTGANRAVTFIKKNLKLDAKTADSKDSETVVQICTRYAQKGTLNIFVVVFCATLAFAFFDPNFFVAYLFGLALRGLLKALEMANAGGAWDNAKKIVETELKEKGTELHAATVVGDTVGDPYKDTSSVSLNPIIKFSTLFGLLAVDIAIKMKLEGNPYLGYIAFVFFIISCIFAYRSFYRMRIETE